MLDGAVALLMGEDEIFGRDVVLEIDEGLAAGRWRRNRLDGMADRRQRRRCQVRRDRSEEHTSELQSLMRISYAVFCLKKKKQKKRRTCRPHRKLPTHNKK